MKKLLKIIYLLLLPLYSTFGQGLVGVSILDTNMVVGDTIFVPVYVDSSLTGENVSSFNMQFSFSDHYFVVDSAYSDGTISSGWGDLAYNTNTSGKISVASAGSSNLTGTGILLYLRVRAIRGGGPTLSFTDTTKNYFNEGSPRVLLTNGRISISAKPAINVSPNYATITVGDTKQFNAYSGTSPYLWSVTNSAISSIDANGLLTATGKGFTQVVAQDDNGTIDTTDGVVEIRAFKLSTRDTSFYKGQVVDIPVYTTDLIGLNYTSGEITLDVNGSFLTPLEILTTGTILDSYSTPQFSFRDNKLRISFAGTSSLSGSGVLFTIRFQITTANSGGTYLTFSDILFNETDLGNGVQSYFRALELATLSILPNGGELLVGDTLRFSASNGVPPYSWTVSNTSLASVNSSGLLTALNGGVVTLLAEDSFGGSGTSGNINLYDTDVWIPDTTAEIGGVIELPIYMGSLASSHSILALQTNVLFDSSKIKFDQVVTTGTLTSGWSFSVNNMGNKIAIAGANTTGFNTAGAIVKLKFIVAPNAVVGNYSTVALQDFLFNEGSPNARITNGKVTIATMSSPNAPTGLVALLTGATEINLIWTDNSDNESGFKIERSTDTTATWTQIATVSQNTTSYNSTGLTEGTKYFYRVRAYNSNGSSGYTNVASAITPLAAPTNLAGSVIDVNNLALTWTDNSSSETGFILERKEYTTDFSVLDTIPSNEVTYTDTNLVFGEFYTYRIKAFNGIGESNYSNLFNISINNPFPNSPSSLSAILDAVDSSGIIYVSWIDNSSNELGFILEHSINAVGSWSVLDSLNADETFFTDSNLVDGREYFYRVAAFNNSGNSAYSDIASETTIMNPPTDLTLTQTENQKVALTWVDNSQSEDGYIIERQDGIVTPVPNFVTIDTVGVNISTFLDSNFTAETGYIYRVRGFNSKVQSTFTNEVSITLTGVNSENEIPDNFELFQNYPNPFNPTTIIKFGTPEASQANIVIYNLLGEKVATLFSEQVDAGYHEINWNARNNPSGVYLISIRLESTTSKGVYSFTKKAILLK